MSYADYCRSPSIEENGLESAYPDAPRCVECGGIVLQGLCPLHEGFETGDGRYVHVGECAEAVGFSTEEDSECAVGRPCPS